MLVQTRAFPHMCRDDCAVCRWVAEHPWLYQHSQESKVQGRVELTEHVPNASDSSLPPRRDVIRSGEQLAAVPWMRKWMRRTDGWPFRGFWYRDGLVLAVYGDNDLWLVVAHASANPGLPLWVPPKVVAE